jgi:hypothetical protein
LQPVFDPTFSVIEVPSGEGIMSKQEAPSVGPGHGMDRNNLPPEQMLCPYGGRLPAPSSAPNLLRRAGASPTVAGGGVCVDVGVHAGNARVSNAKLGLFFTVFQHVFVLFRPLRAYAITRILKRFQNPLRTQKIVLACGTLFVEPYLLHA